MSLMAKQVVYSCDGLDRGQRCGKPADTFTLTKGEESWELDLCPKHSDDMWARFVEYGRAAHSDPIQAGRITHDILHRPWDEDRV